MLPVRVGGLSLTTLAVMPTGLVIDNTGSIVRTVEKPGTGTSLTRHARPAHTRSLAGAPPDDVPGW